MELAQKVDYQMEGLNLEPKPSKLFNRLQLRCLITVWRDIFPIFSQVFLKMFLANFMVLKKNATHENESWGSTLIQKYTSIEMDLS